MQLMGVVAKRQQHQELQDENRSQGVADIHACLSTRGALYSLEPVEQHLHGAHNQNLSHGTSFYFRRT
jgi:hypothetical protein